jgi:hypothetical protein
MATLLSMSERGDGAPTNNTAEIYGILSNELKGYTDALAEIWATDLVAVPCRKERCYARNRRQTGLGIAIRCRGSVNLPVSGSRPNTTTESER